jgi:signal transduction histidine kinase
MLADKRHISVKFSQTKLKKKDEPLAILYDIASDLTSSLSLTEILDRAIDKVMEHLKKEAVRIYLLDEDEQQLQLAAHKGIPKKHLESLRTIRMDEGFSGKAARTKSFVAQKVSELENGQRSTLLQSMGFKVIICIPLIVRDKVVGVMNLASKRMVQLSEGKIDLLVAIGNQIAIAVNVARVHEEVQKRVEEIRRMRDDIEFFAYTISHDLKNPAIGIAGFARLLAQKHEHTLDKQGRRYCDQISKAAGEIERFTRDINEYIKSKKASLDVERTDVKRILSHIRREFAPVLQERNITWKEPDTIPKIMADQVAMTRVFRNLIDNALKHAGRKLSKITISHRQSKRFHIFSFSNDGIPVKTKDAEVIFQMFSRLPSSQGVEGSGLGLSIVKEIVEAHKGKVWVESGLRKDTTFYIAMPKHLNQQE